MQTVRFRWSPWLVEIRRETCPNARWLAAERAWRMTEADAKAFLQASHTMHHASRRHCEIMIDRERWLIGFAQGAPLRIE